MPRRQSINGGKPRHENPIPNASRIGNLVMSSVIGGTNPGTRELPESFEAQVANVFAYIRHDVEAAGGGVDDIIMVTFWVRDPASQRAGLNTEWVKLFPDPEFSACATYADIAGRRPIAGSGEFRRGAGLGGFVMLSGEAIETLARAYYAAEKARQRTRAGSVLHANFSIDDAYAVQRKCIDLKLDEGNTVRGRKIGLTSRAMQRATNMNEPDYGALMSDMFYESGAEIPITRFIQPRIECELGFVIGKRLKGPNCTIFEVLNATDYVAPCIEIVDSRTHRIDPETQRPSGVLDSIADNAAAGALVVGGRPFRPLDVDLRWIAALCHRNGTIEESGVAAAVLNHPANGVAWLANKLSAFDVGLEPGEFILAGSFTGMVEARAGDTFHIDYGSFGSITCHFA